MQTQIKFGNIRLSAQVESTQDIPDGILLKGSQVAIRHPFGKTCFYRQGFHSWSLTSWIPLDMVLPPPSQEHKWPQMDDPVLLSNYPFSSSDVSALQGPGGKVLLLGALELDAHLKADEQALRGEYPMEQTTPLWFLTYVDEQAAFARYAELLIERHGKRGQGRPPRVWCSWYSYFREIDEGVMLGTLSSLKGLPFDVFQVDDGWQQTLGDWQANDKFPSGMTALAKSVQQAGFTPGLWLAPFIVQPSSKLYRDHPDWLLRDETGNPVRAGHNWGDFYYTLDVTNPQVQTWLTDLITRVRGWGFDYLKLDFLYAAALPGKRNQNMPGEEAYRLGLTIMRQAAGDAYILACGAPILATLGLADGLRIGPDVASYWNNEELSAIQHDLTGPGTLNAIRTSLHRLWLRPMIQVDPDVTFFRTRYNLLKPQEKRYLQNLALISDFRATSDPPDWLDPEERQELTAFLNASPKVEQLARYRFQIDGHEIDYGFLEEAWPA